MKQLTNEMIINKLNKDLPFLKYELTVLCVGVLLFVLLLVCYLILKKKKEKKERAKSNEIDIIRVLIVVGITIWLGITAGKCILKYNAINYSLKNDSWHVEIDTIKEKEIKKSSSIGSKPRRRETTDYYIHLRKNGRVLVNSGYFTHLNYGDEMYVVIVKGRCGGTYFTELMYPTDEYVYN